MASEAMVVAPLEEDDEEDEGAVKPEVLVQLCQSHGEAAVVSVGIGEPLKVRRLPLQSRHTVNFYGGAAWPSGEILAHFVAACLTEHLQSPCNIVEVGCGVTALPSLVARRVGATVLATDVPEVLSMTAQNARDNDLDIKIEALDWRSSAEETLERFGGFDVVLGADVLTDGALHLPLLMQLEALLSHGGCALIVFPRGRPGQVAFFQHMLPEAGWNSRSIELSQAFDAMGTTEKSFRSHFELRACWREADEGFWQNIAENVLDTEGMQEIPAAPPESDDESR